MNGRRRVERGVAQLAEGLRLDLADAEHPRMWSAQVGEHYRLDLRDRVLVLDEVAQVRRRRGRSR